MCGREAPFALSYLSAPKPHTHWDRVLWLFGASTSRHWPAEFVHSPKTRRNALQVQKDTRHRSSHRLSRTRQYSALAGTASALVSADSASHSRPAAGPEANNAWDSPRPGGWLPGPIRAAYHRGFHRFTPPSSVAPRPTRRTRVGTTTSHLPTSPRSCGSRRTSCGRLPPALLLRRWGGVRVGLAEAAM